MNFVDVLWIMLGLCLCVIVLYSIIQWGHHFLLHKKGVGAQERIVHEILDTAIGQHSLFQLDFDSGELKKYKITGTCIELQENWMQLYVNSGFASTAWSGEQVTVQFQVSFRRKASFFQFHSRIADVLRTGKNFTLRLNLPNHLEPGQKRNTLRVAPQHDSVLHMRLWLLDDTTPMPACEADIPPTELEMRPDATERVHLDNLSAGGTRITLTGTELTVPLEQLRTNPNTRVLFMLVLQTSDETAPLALWLSGKVISNVGNDGKSLTLGIRFLQWAAVQPEQRPISWLPTADENGVAPLAAWVMRHHLEQSRRL